MGVKVTNNAFGTLSAGINTTVTTVTLDSGQGARFPSLGASEHFYGTLVDTSNNIEIVKVTARSTDSMTVVRGQDNTTAGSYAIGDRFELRPVAALFEEKFNAAGGTISGATTIEEDGATVLTVDRATDDGTAIDVQKDGSSIGGIGVKSGDLAIYSTDGSHSGLRFADGAVIPTNASGNVVDDSIDLGKISANYRFKDLYLSGGVYLGGTASANHMDDYEEGTVTGWRLTKSDTSGGFVGTKINETVTYVKTGRLVHLEGYIRTNSISGTGNVKIQGTLPFAPAKDVALPITHTRTVDELGTMIHLHLDAGSTSNLFIRTNNEVNDYTGQDNNTGCNTQTNIVVQFSGTYYTNS